MTTNTVAPLITHLRHVDIAMPNFAEQRAFYQETWGLTETAHDSGVSFLAAEGSPEQYVVRLRQDGQKRTDLIAFGAAGPADVDALAERLIAQGVRLVHEPRVMDTPGGGYGVQFFDNEGRVVEVSADVAVRKHRKIEAREPVPVKLSHVLMNTPTPEATVRWYTDHLGFRLTDTMCIGDREIMWFLRCNTFHHSFGFVRGPHAAFHHASFEMRGIDEFMRGTGRLHRLGYERLWGPGRHLAGDNSFSYFLDKAGNTVEYTTEVETIDQDTWHPHLYDVRDPANSDVWGTANDMNEFVAARSQNDVDRGLFVAPPM
ncbi:VOC family protein [Streptomyces melanosporofaciens]|uniref:Catechol-2,3-dioxygenase n=1 Tax=Streptomyces melanosporofaciens TaxID=67327 RepID=A0A1H4KC80_STRMJ|nr:VOC family protein [Streptomyces melanosporofaciens]SEB55638.1 Catechol-2,3-dioxygenase [Streptomyces melanosporofaciens]